MYNEFEEYGITRSSNFSHRLCLALEWTDTKKSTLADGIGVNRAMLTRYCSGEREPRPKTKQKIADFLKVNELWLEGYDVDWEERIEWDPQTQEIFKNSYWSLDNIEMSDLDLVIENEDAKRDLFDYIQFLLVKYNLKRGGSDETSE